MDQRAYYVLHLIGLLVLTAYTFRAFAAPTPETRSANVTVTLASAVVVLVTGFGLLTKLQLEMGGWLIVKMLCLLVFSALAGLTHKKGSASALPSLALLVLVIAVLCVYYKPF